jgi:anaerobic ribonucleoside-triphosphate reductase
MENLVTICWDCLKNLKPGDEYMPYKVGNDTLMKCVECHKKNPVLENFRECEVYSRVVGYIRPVKQWNKGKKQEFKDRVNYKLN